MILDLVNIHILSCRGGWNSASPLYGRGTIDLWMVTIFSKTDSKQWLMQCIFYTTAFLQEASMVACLHLYKYKTRPSVNLSYQNKSLYNSLGGKDKGMGQGGDQDRGSSLLLILNIIELLKTDIFHGNSQTLIFIQSHLYEMP